MSDATITVWAYPDDVSSPLRLRFVQSAAKVSQLPEADAEVAFIGRSNVGKSSLINALANQTRLARTSKTPGATRLLNIFEIEGGTPGRWLVDLPGYGFAHGPKADQQKWKALIEEYLSTRETLLAGIVLIDGAIGPTKLDLQTIEWLEHIDLPYRFVATKWDKVKSSKRNARKNEILKALGVPSSDVRWVSAAKGTGIPELRGDIHSILAD